MLGRKNRRGQAALEFLTTYGWAFLVVLVMIGALAYFGVLDPKIFLPEKCVFGAGIGCVESAGITGASDGKILAILKNGFGYGIVIENVTIDVTGDRDVCIECSSGNDNCNMTVDGENWKADTRKNLEIACPSLESGSHPNVRVNIQYHKAGGNYPKIIQGQIQVKPV